MMMSAGKFFLVVSHNISNSRKTLQSLNSRHYSLKCISFLASYSSGDKMSSHLRVDGKASRRVASGKVVIIPSPDALPSGRRICPPRSCSTDFSPPRLFTSRIFTIRISPRTLSLKYSPPVIY